MKTLGLTRGQLLILFFAAAVILLFFAYKKIDADTTAQIKTRYEEASAQMREQAEQLVTSKMQTTLALAISLSQNSDLKTLPQSRSDAVKKYSQYIETMRDETPFKNVWLEVTDEEGIYRSWRTQQKIVPDAAPKKGCNAPAVFLQGNEEDLLITAAVPLDGAPCSRMLYVHTHFNSISDALQRKKIDAVVLANEATSGTLRDPFSGMFAGPYYVANKHASKTLIERAASAAGTDSCSKPSYTAADGFLQTGVPLLDDTGAPLGCMMLFRSIETIAIEDLRSKSTSLKMLLFTAMSILIALLGWITFFFQKRQKAYYKEIIDSSSNVIIVTDGVEIIDVNRTFFSYLPTAIASIDAFKEKYNCICDFFVIEDGFLAPEMEHETWVEYAANRPEKRHIAKIKVEDDVYYFQVKAAKLKQSDDQRFSVVFTDITREYLDEIELERISLTDPLTKVWNRRYFDETMQKEFERSRRYGYLVSLLMIDIDHFKKINDRYGHAIGDKVLVTLCESLNIMLRKEDSFCRIGGEEFAVILPHTSRENALIIADRMRKRALEIAVDETIHFTISIGVCECGKSVEACYQSADKALYLAKYSGRNRVEQCMQQTVTL